MPSPFHIGISGWTYKPWRGVFYPDNLPIKKELEYASRQVNSIEINGTFYGLQKPSSFSKWRDETPDDFVFSVKGSRYITHIKRAKDVREPLANFLASGIFALREKLGPLLWQFPPNFKFDAERLEAFFKFLPPDTKAAAKLAKAHTLDSKRALTKADCERPLYHAMEIRHDSFKTPAFIDLLRKYNISLVFADTVKWPYMEDVTGDIIYARLHGSEDLYVSGYSERALSSWAKRFGIWAAGGEPPKAKKIAAEAPVIKPRDIFVYFDNDVKVHAPFNAQSLARRLAG